jgi:thiol-disulfide isomerase/thioredoxin
MLTAALILVSASLSGSAAAGEEFRGVLEPRLRPAPPRFLVVLERVPQPPADLGIPADATAFGGSLLWTGESPVQVLLVEPHSGRPSIFVDTDQNGVFGADERFSFSRTRNRSGRWLAHADLPLAGGGAFPDFPLALLLADDRVTLPFPASPPLRYLLQSGFSYASAKVRIGGRSYFFRYAFNPETRTIDPATCLQLLDEGHLNDDELSPWRAWGKRGPPVFRIGHRYVATRAVDPAGRSVVIETRNASDYKRLELYRGLKVPDFSFRDIDGRTHHLADFRGRFVLLNMWYPGCGPCTDEFRYLRKAAERFAPEDLVILGMSLSDPPGGRLKDVSAASPPSWIEAEPQSVHRLIDEWLQISATPTPILLDREGRVLVLQRKYERTLRGEELLRTLERVIGRGRTSDR